jgi:hypothetical protein
MGISVEEVFFKVASELRGEQPQADVMSFLLGLDKEEMFLRENK